MKIQETITTVKTLDNTTATYENGMFGMVELDETGGSFMDNPLDNDCNGIRFSINLGYRNGTVYSKSDGKDGDIDDLYSLVNKIENNNIATYHGENSPIDCEWQIDSNGYEIEDEDGNLIENPRHSDRQALDDTEYLDNLIAAAKEKGFYIAGVDVYEHSAYAFRLTGFDSRWYDGSIAWASPEDMQAAGLNTEEDCDNRARAILEEYQAWTNGEIYACATAPAEYDEENDIVTITGEWEYLSGFTSLEWAEKELPGWMSENRPAAATA